MTWLRDSGKPLRRHPRWLAGFSALTAIGVLYLLFRPAFAGSDGKQKPSGPRVATVTRDTAKPSTLLTVPNPASTDRRTDADSVAATDGDRIAMLMNLTLLEQGRRRLAECADYTCTLFKQERISGELTDGQSIELKLRHRPFSVYMKWASGDKGREALYVEGVDDNRMTVHPGGWKARIVPALKIDPEGSLAMSEARHPVTMVGLIKLCDELTVHRKSELAQRHPVRCRLLENEVLNDRPCFCFVSTYLDRKCSEDYRKSIQYVDKEWLLPICVKNYAWPEAKQTFADENALDEATLIEHYAYSELQFNQQLAAKDFDRANEAYGFRR
jgi:Protein of unknown function (DUF1571)